MPRGADAYTRKQYSLRCETHNCKLCTGFVKEEQHKADYKTFYTAKRDEEAFQQFIKEELNEDGMVKKTLEKEKRDVERDAGGQEDVRIDYLRDLKS